MGLSVVVPLHNGAATIEDTLESLARQTEPLAEVIVVDDGSTDEGFEIAGEHRLNPTVIRLPRNSGVAFARNTGVLATSSEFVTFLDQDDMWLPTRAARLTEALSDRVRPRVLMTREVTFAAEEDRSALESAHHPYAGQISRWHKTGRALDLLDDVAMGQQPLAPTKVADREFMTGTLLLTTTFVVPRDLVLQVGGFPTWLRSADDWFLLQVLSLHADIYRIDEPSVLYRVHPENGFAKIDWSMRLTLSAAALRYGGVAVPEQDARDAASVGRLADSGFFMHLLVSRANAHGLRSRADVVAVWQLLATDRHDRERSGRRLFGVIVRSLVPDRMRQLARQLRMVGRRE